MWFPSLQFAQILRSIPLSGTWGSQKNMTQNLFQVGIIDIGINMY